MMRPRTAMLDQYTRPWITYADYLEAEIARLKASATSSAEVAMERDVENRRLRDHAARALERTQVADDSSGAADEATAILEGVVTLDGQYVGVKP